MSHAFEVAFYLLIYPTISISIHPSLIYLSFYLYIIYLSNYLPTCQSINVYIISCYSVSIFLNTFFKLTAYLSINLSTYLSIFTFFYPPIYENLISSERVDYVGFPIRPANLMSPTWNGIIMLEPPVLEPSVKGLKTKVYKHVYNV